MKTKISAIVFLVVMALVAASCKKQYDTNSLIDDKNKIDIKGSLSNGDMRSPNLEAGYWSKTVYVYFHDYMGECVVSISDKHNHLVFCDTVTTGYDTGTRFFMGDQPLGRYHLVISNGTDSADGWFNNFWLVVVKPKH